MAWCSPVARSTSTSSSKIPEPSTLRTASTAASVNGCGPSASNIDPTPRRAGAWAILREWCSASTSPPARQPVMLTMSTVPSS